MNQFKENVADKEKIAKTIQITFDILKVDYDEELFCDCVDYACSLVELGMDQQMAISNSLKDNNALAKRLK